MHPHREEQKQRDQQPESGSRFHTAGTHEAARFGLPQLRRRHDRVAEVFGKRGADGAADFGGVEFHAHKMTPAAKRKSKF
jgi:hypothetical protein